MKMLFLSAVVAILAPAVLAKVWVTPYCSDETTPLVAVDPNHPTVYRDIMVGARLVLLIQSDAPGLVRDHLLWSGKLRIPWDDWQRGTLSGRGYNEQRRVYEGSCLPAAGYPSRPIVRLRVAPDGVGFDLAVDLFSVAGDWFVLDYHAEQRGTCTISLSDITNPGIPIQTLSFTHVPTRDFDSDTRVNFRDFALLASQWGAKADPNCPNAVFDLDANSRIDAADLTRFSQYWLERTDCHPAAPEPNQLAQKH